MGNDSLWHDLLHHKYLQARGLCIKVGLLSWYSYDYKNYYDQQNKLQSNSIRTTHSIYLREYTNKQYKPWSAINKPVSLYQNNQAIHSTAHVQHTTPFHHYRVCNTASRLCFTTHRESRITAYNHVTHIRHCTNTAPSQHTTCNVQVSMSFTFS